MNPSSLKIFNARIITPNGIIAKGTLLAENGKIIEIAEGIIDYDAATIIDAEGNFVSPGFIDIHVHGGGGHDFMDNTVEAFLKIAETHAQHGTTSLTPTTLSSEKEELIRTLELYEQAELLNKNGASFIGMHIEGPYFCMEQRGAQDPRYIRLPDPNEYEAIVEKFPFIRRWSAAPELEGAIAFGKYMQQKNILPAIAHTNATYEETLEAFQYGFNHVTHFYSCTSTVMRRKTLRYAGVVESAYLLDDMTVEIIADGRHLPAALLKLVYKLKGADKTALITDAMRAAGMPPGESILGSSTNGLRVLVEDGVAILPDRSAFAGSVATTDQLVRNSITLAGIPLADAIKMITITPATIMGIAETKGSLLAGKDADIVVFDDDINIQYSIVGGRVVFLQQKKTD
jgi:N-acetylglucosamine-6-phosphate deacetylase